MHVRQRIGDSPLATLPLQVLPQRRFNDALVRHPALPFILDPRCVPPQPPVLLSGQPQRQRVRVILRTSDGRRGTATRHWGRRGAFGHGQVVQLSGWA